MGGPCPLGARGIGHMLRLLANRSGTAENLIVQIARGDPISSTLSAAATINSYPMSAASLRGQPTTLALGLEVLRISAIDQKKQMYKMHYILKWKWRDCRMLMKCHHID